jgi:hypothetical protein
LTVTGDQQLAPPLLSLLLQLHSVGLALLFRLLQGQPRAVIEGAGQRLLDIGKYPVIGQRRQEQLANRGFGS